MQLRYDLTDTAAVNISCVGGEQQIGGTAILRVAYA